jgi:hypothetical protein
LDNKEFLPLKGNKGSISTSLLIAPFFYANFLKMKSVSDVKQNVRKLAIKVLDNYRAGEEHGIVVVKHEVFVEVNKILTMQKVLDIQRFSKLQYYDNLKCFGYSKQPEFFADMIFRQYHNAIVEDGIVTGFYRKNCGVVMIPIIKVNLKK